MVKPLEILQKILRLEEEDYQYQDKAVSGGLSRYVGTWLSQAEKAYGATPWVQDVANRLEAYSTLSVEAREEAMQDLWRVLRAGPEAPEAKVKEALLLHLSRRRRNHRLPLSRPARKDAARCFRVVAFRRWQEARIEQLENLGVTKIGDLLRLYPHRYEDYSTLKTINRLEYGERVSVLATVFEAGGRRTRGGQHLFKAILSDETGTLPVTWFNQPYLAKRIRPGMRILSQWGGG